jgi:2-dehydropantoate 2-reductase
MRLAETPQTDWPRVAVMGAGAVGCYFGGMLARAGAMVTLIGRRSLVEALARDGLFLDSIHFQESVAVAASTDASAARGAKLVLFAVKTVDTPTAARELAPHLDAGATLLSLQNGVDNVARIREAAGFDAIPAAVYVAAHVTAPGRIKHLGRGDLIVGEPSGATRRKDEIERVAQTFIRAGVPCRISGNIESDLWVKMVMNCAGNAVSALGQATYGRAARDAAAREVIAGAANEAMAVARAAGVRLPDGNLIEAGLKLAETLDEATSSTAQDIARGKRTEIDSLNGYIVRRGRELGVPTPINLTLYALVKLLEERNAPQP